VNWKLRNKKGNLNHSSKTITQKIIEEYKQAEITGFYYKEKYFPFITACFVYDEFMINDTVILNLDGSVDYGYSISSGKFDDLEEANYFFYKDDKTISSLLYYIDLFLDTPLSNTIYTRPSSMFPVNPGGNIPQSLFSFTREEYSELIKGQGQSL
jgi:hypothetical protein